MPVMFDCQKIESVGPDQIEDDVIIDDELPEIVTLAERGFKSIHECLSFHGPDGMSQQGTARLRKAAQGRHDIVEEAVYKPSKGTPSLGFQEQTDGVQIRGEIFAEIGPEASGHTGP